MRRVFPLVLLLSLLLTACFRDASEDRRDPTTVNVQTLNASQSEPAASPTAGSTAVATLTPTPRIAPSSTFPIGGPPIESDEEEETPETSDEEDPIVQRTLPPTQRIASFTPSGSTFGDPGITPTAISTQPIPDALITPTGIAEEFGECTYVVQANDTLFSIATQFNVTVDEFVAANTALAANPNVLAIGQQLLIPGCTPEGQGGGMVETEGKATPDSTPTQAAAPGTVTHTVADGETLFRIAIQYNTSVEAILAANPDLNGSTIIYPGQVLVIPEQP